MNEYNFMTRVLSDFCTLHDIDFKSADDILYADMFTLKCEHKLSDDQKEWLKSYIKVWESLSL
tara:strand:+ start:909 stop:1097 length:189 start_codon:yes stop_codon:yes gene_type:complete